MAAGWWQFRGARGVCCCSSTSFSPARVSAPFTLSPRTPALMPCDHPRATLRFRSRLFPHTLTCATHASLSQGHIGARRRAAKPQDGSRQRIDYCYGRLRQPRGSRGLRGAQDALEDAARPHAYARPCESRPRARSLTARSAAQRPRLPPWLRPRLPWPQVRPPSSSQEPFALRSPRPCNRARPARHPGCGA